ncbi:serine/threonine-protein kinase pim-3-like [Oncorhynchus nerka]|uniref:serine/threonine-protein kinase pim-3-like n=1 Tax=Oncorhynchus nerka TaxID=8023 RepID=UPI0031B882A8
MNNQNKGLRMKRKCRFNVDRGERPTKKRSSQQAITKMVSLVLPCPQLTQSTLQKLQIESEADPDWPTPMETRAISKMPRKKGLPTPKMEDKGTQCDMGSKRKRMTFFQDLDSDDLRTAKKIKVTMASGSYSSFGSSTSTDASTSSERTDSKGSEVCDKHKTKVRRNPPRRASFTSLYNVGKLLGQGGCGSVYEGTRKEDGREVAIKYIPKGVSEYYLTIPGTTHRLPLEVALMQIVSRPPVCEHVLELVDWFEQPRKFILVLERPTSCMDLYDYCETMGGKLNEAMARVIMLQVVLAVRHCRDRGVIHRDIKVENLLVQTDTLNVKLIDFGCGDLLREKLFRDFAGTTEFSPPEWVLDGKYQGRKATIWSLGVLLFGLVNGDLPFRKEAEIIRGRLRFKRGISKECRDLVRWCLKQDPLKRPVLEQILLHDWLSDRARP